MSANESHAALPDWLRFSAAGAPSCLIGGWTLAAARQTDGFDPVVQTISALAGHGAREPWIMTLALLIVGACHIVTAAGLRIAAPWGRAVLALGGAGTMAVAALPLTPDEPSTAHFIAACTALGGVALWPLVGWRRDPWTPRCLQPGPSLLAGAALCALLLWLVAELNGGVRLGLAERAAAGAQACWPLLVVVLSARHRAALPAAQAAAPQSAPMPQTTPPQAAPRRSAPPQAHPTPRSR